jgi:DNA-binding LytR/AlgR family response regulator
MTGTFRTYNAIIVDDNEIDRLSTRMYVSQYPFIDIKGVFESATAAAETARNGDIDILFLDIDMPELNGLEFRKTLGDEQVCIFITSYPDYAVDSFELAPLDFLVKPLSKERFAMAMSRLKDYLEIKEKAALFSASLGGDTVFIKDGHSQVKIRLHEILYLEALKDYTRIVTRDKKYCVLSILGNLLQETAFNSFLRIHRSYAVQKHFINRISSQEVFLENITLPLGRSYKPSVEHAIAGK